MIRIHDVETLQRENLEAFPGFELILDGYVCIAQDIESTGEGVYIHQTENDPKVLLVFHDYGETTAELIDNAETLLPRFSDLFRLGKVE